MVFINTSSEIDLFGFFNRLFSFSFRSLRGFFPQIIIFRRIFSVSKSGSFLELIFSFSRELSVAFDNIIDLRTKLIFEK